MKLITGLPPKQQLTKLNELASQYNVDLKKIMGINVAFDIVDNTDDAEPVRGPKELQIQGTSLEQETSQSVRPSVSLKSSPKALRKDSTKFQHKRALNQMKE